MISQYRSDFGSLCSGEKQVLQFLILYLRCAKTKNPSRLVIHCRNAQFFDTEIKALILKICQISTLHSVFKYHTWTLLIMNLNLPTCDQNRPHSFYLSVLKTWIHVHTCTTPHHHNIATKEDIILMLTDDPTHMTAQCNQ